MSLSIVVDYSCLSVSLPCAYLVHAAIDSRNVDIQIASIGCDGVVRQASEFLEMNLLHYGEGLSFEEGRRVVIVLLILLWNVIEEFVKKIRYSSTILSLHLSWQINVPFQIRDEVKSRKYKWLIRCSQSEMNECLYLEDKVLLEAVF